MHKLSLVPQQDSAQLIYPAPSKPFKAPFYEVSAGYPSAAQDYLEQELDINEYMLGSPCFNIPVQSYGNVYA